MEYTVYTDGSCKGNPGRGGIGAVVYLDGVQVYTFSQGYCETTNNRMELMAVIFVLGKYANVEDITIWTDSEYVRKGVTEWLDGWKKNGWMRNEGGRKKPVKNADLWKKLDELNKKHIKYRWVKGHSNEEGNETADSLATCSSTRGPFIRDEGFYSASTGGLFNG